MLPAFARRRVAGDTGRGWGRKFVSMGHSSDVSPVATRSRGCCGEAGRHRPGLATARTSVLPPSFKMIFLGHKLVFTCKLETVWYYGP